MRQGRSVLAFVGVLAAASLLASVGLIQQAPRPDSVLLASDPPHAAPSRRPVSCRLVWAPESACMAEGGKAMPAVLTLPAP